MKDLIITILIIVVIMLILTAITTALLMLLWNWLVTSIFGLREITFLEALGISFLANLIFRVTVSIIKHN